LTIENHKSQIEDQSDENRARDSRCDRTPQSSILNPQSSFLSRLHSDQRGTVSIMTVFALFMFTILLVKVVNVGRHVDDKVRRQNAADAGAYSGGVVMARGMNTLAFTNHLEAEVFALDAYMRTAQMRDDNGDLTVQSLTPDILAKWEEIGKIFEQHGGQSGYSKFRLLGRAIQQKVPLERDLVAAFSEMAAHHAELTLPVLEYILHAGEADTFGGAGGSFGSAVNVPEGGIIPRFQRALVQAVPRVADLTANEVARRYGRSGERMRRNQTPLHGRMWRTDAVSFAAADETDPLTRTMPAIDPSPTGVDGPPDRSYYVTARQQRESLAKHYLELWIRDWMGPYFSYAQGLNGRNRPGRDTAKMSQFINLWRTFTCGHLRILLDVEYPDTNLPHVIRKPYAGISGNQSLQRDFQYVSVTYWEHLEEMFPGLFKNRMKGDPGSDAQTFAQVAVFLPRNRHLCCPWAWPFRVTLPDGTTVIRWRNNREGMPQHWDLLNQNWQCKLVPARAENLPAILEQAPDDLPNFRPPRFNGVSAEDFKRLTRH